MDKRVLIVCRTQDELGLLRHFKQESGAKYIVASDDVRVHKAAGKMSWVSDVCWLEKKESFYCVAKDVIRILDIVNDWLKNIGKEEKWMPEELFYWIKHCEGGMTTQRIQDLLLLIRSYLYLIEKYQVGEIVILKSPGMEWEDEVFCLTAKSRKVLVKEIGKYRPGVILGRFWLRMEVYFRSAYYFLNCLRLKLKSVFVEKNSKGDKKEILFQLCSSSRKHVENIVPLMKVLREIGYEPVALCWDATHWFTEKTGFDQVREEGLAAESLESRISFSCLLTAILNVFKIWKKVTLRGHEFLRHPRLLYNSVHLGKLLWPSVRYFFKVELMLRQLLWAGIAPYLEFHDPVAAKPWGNGVLAEGAILAIFLKKRNVLMFGYFLGVYITNPYANKEVGRLLDLFLAAGEIEKKKVIEELSFPEESVAVVGKGRYEHLVSFKKDKKNFNLQSLFSGKKVSRCIFYDPGAILRGYQSTAEYVELTNGLLEFAQENPEVGLIIKPHPSGDVEILKEMVVDSGCENVYLADKRNLPYKYINVSDVVITKFSTVGIEAMLLDVPVIAVILDGEENFKIYEDAVEYVFNIDKLKILIHSIFICDNKYKCWMRDRIRLQQDFLKRYFYSSAVKPSKLSGKIINNFIASKHSL